MRPPILITGCARSGTSMTSGIIDICGAFGGLTSGPTRHNRKGMFENALIRNEIVKPYLGSMGLDPKGQSPLPDVDNLAKIPDLRRKVEAIFRSQGYTEGPWYYKGAKLCLVWPIWHMAFPDAQWIIVRRKDEDITQSCMRTGFMSAFKAIDGWQEWVNHHKSCFRQMHGARLDIMEVWPHKFVGGDFSEIKDVVEKLGLSWNMDEVCEFVDPALWSGHNGTN